MNNDFYNNLITQIKNLIVSKNYLDALEIVKKELNMPYIPNKIENELINFKIFLESKERDIKEKKVSFNDILKFINNTRLATNEKYEMLNLLSLFNLREYLDVIKEILLRSDINDSLKLKIINELKKQDIKEVLTFLFKNKKVTLDLDKMIEVSNNKDFVNDSRKIEKFLFKDPITYNFALNFLEILYLNNLVLLNKVNDIWIEVVYVVAKSLDYKEILTEIKPLIKQENDFNNKVHYIVNNTNFI